MQETDPRVRRTRKLLLDAFAALLSEKRLHDISVQDIAERATVNRATFYAHFVDKYALLDELVSEWFRQTVTAHVSPEAPFTRDNLTLLVVAIFDSQAQFHSHCQQQTPGQDMSPAMEVKVQQELSAYLRGWLARAPSFAARPAAAREAVASALSWAIFGAAIEWRHGGRTPAARERATQLVSVLTNGIAGMLVDADAADARTARDAPVAAGGWQRR